MAHKLTVRAFRRHRRIRIAGKGRVSSPPSVSFLKPIFPVWRKPKKTCRYPSSFLLSNGPSYQPDPGGPGRNISGSFGGGGVWGYTGKFCWVCQNVKSELSSRTLDHLFVSKPTTHPTTNIYHPPPIHVRKAPPRATCWRAPRWLVYCAIESERRRQGVSERRLHSWVASSYLELFAAPTSFPSVHPPPHGPNLEMFRLAHRRLTRGVVGQSLEDEHRRVFVFR